MSRSNLSLLVAGLSWPPETFLERLLTGLSAAGVEITVAASAQPARRGEPSSDIRHLGVGLRDGWSPSSLARLGWLGGRAAFVSPRDLVAAASLAFGTPHSGWRPDILARLLPFAGRRWDVIYFPWTLAAGDYLPLFDRRSAVVVSCRGSQIYSAPHNPDRAAAREVLGAVFRRAAAVHCVCESIKAEAAAYGLESAKARVIPPGVDPDFFSPAPMRATGDAIFRVVTTGSLGWVKGHEYALLAIRQALDGGCRVSFDILGDGPERQRLLYTIQDLGLEPHVRLHGRVSPEHVRDQFRQSAVFLLSSVSEGISNAVLEAMACGLPIVTTNCGGMPEAVSDGKEGCVVPVRDPGSIARALVRLAFDEALRARMGHAARQRVLREFTLDRQVQEFVDLFEDVARD